MAHSSMYVYFSSLPTGQKWQKQIAYTNVCTMTEEDILIYIAVRTTSVILLLGVGSFVCYKLYCQLRQRFRRRRKSKRETASLRKAHVRSWISGVEHGSLQVGRAAVYCIKSLHSCA